MRNWRSWQYSASLSVFVSPPTRFVRLILQNWKSNCRLFISVSSGTLNGQEEVGMWDDFASFAFQSHLFLYT